MHGAVERNAAIAIFGGFMTDWRRDPCRDFLQRLLPITSQLHPKPHPAGRRPLSICDCYLCLCPTDSETADDADTQTASTLSKPQRPTCETIHTLSRFVPSNAPTPPAHVAQVARTALRSTLCSVVIAGLKDLQDLVSHLRKAVLRPTWRSDERSTWQRQCSSVSDIVAPPYPTAHWATVGRCREHCTQHTRTRRTGCCVLRHRHESSAEAVSFTSDFATRLRPLALGAMPAWL